MVSAMNTNDRPDFNITPAPSHRRRPLPSVPRTAPTASNPLSSPSLSNSGSTSPDAEVLPKYPSLPPAYSAFPTLPDEKKTHHADVQSTQPIHSASTTYDSLSASTPASSTFSTSSTVPSSPPVARSWPTSPARMPITPPRSVPASPSLVPPALTALAIPPSPAPHLARGENLSALWSAEVQPSAIEPHRQSFTQVLSRIEPPPPTRTPTARTPTATKEPERLNKSAVAVNVRESKPVRTRTGSSPALQAPGPDVHIKATRRSASAHHLKQRSDAEIYNLPRGGNSFLTLASPESAIPAERPPTPSLKQDIERITRKHERGRPRAPGVDVAFWVQQTVAQSTRLVGEPATPHPARSPPAAPHALRDPAPSREPSASRSVRGRSARGPSAFRPPQAPLPATPSAHRTETERPHTSHQRAHTLADVPRHGFRSEPDLVALTKPKHNRSTSERMMMTSERPPLPSSPPLRRDSLVPPPRSTTPKLLRNLTNRAKHALSGRSRVNSNADVPPTPPLPSMHAMYA
ncbi:hypothetical protein PENSPDRAFT_360042 [Peniophora sp. CONT]|nr:hypothetical protein PENSPDRAFT_360042 [Peniophora sp. CONT]